MSSFLFVDIGQQRYGRDREPNECPICHFAVQPEEIDWAVSSQNGSTHARDMLEIVYKCPRRECNRYFVARYRRHDPPTNLQGYPIGREVHEFVWYESVPATPRRPYVPDEVTSLSPVFAETYLQSCAAESLGLDQIAGGGFRKSLEFLIKDYCTSVIPEAAEEIASSYLGQCINRFVDSPQVKLCAQRAAWLGNDELHYVRKWTDKDISNLKELIILTMNWVHSSILTRKYGEDMPEGST